MLLLHLYSWGIVENIVQMWQEPRMQKTRILLVFETLSVFSSFVFLCFLLMSSSSSAVKVHYTSGH